MPTRRAQSECVSRHPTRWHRVHRHASLGDGHRHSHDAADGGRRRARRGLEPRAYRTGHWRCSIRRSEHRRLAIDSRLLRRVPTGRCVSAVDARQRSGGAVECARQRVHDRESRGPASGQWPTAGVWRARAGSREAVRAEGRESPVQAEERLALHRSGDVHLRSAGHRHGQGAVRSRRVPRRNGLRVDRASARARRHGEERQRRGGARGQGRAADGDARHVQAAASVPAARRRRGHRQQHVGGAAGPAEAQGRLERRRRTACSSPTRSRSSWCRR